MQKLLALIVLATAACDSPTPHFRGIPATTVTVDGSTFAVRRRGDIAEAVRTNTELLPGFDSVAPRAGRAIAQATGCAVRDLRGDPAVIVARLAC